MAIPGDPAFKGNPDYDPTTWVLGYQSRQFGVASDPVPTGTTHSAGQQSSAYSALADPPAAMTTAIEIALPTVT